MYATRIRVGASRIRIEAPTLAEIMRKLRELTVSTGIIAAFVAAQCLGTYITERM